MQVTDQICGSPTACYCNGLTNTTHYFIPGQNRYVTTNADMPRERYRHAAVRFSFPALPAVGPRSTSTPSSNLHLHYRVYSPAQFIELSVYQAGCVCVVFKAKATRLTGCLWVRDAAGRT